MADKGCLHRDNNPWFITIFVHSSMPTTALNYRSNNGLILLHQELS